MNTDTVSILVIVGLTSWGVLALLENIITPWLAKRIAKEALADIKVGHTTEPRQFEWEIKFDSEGVSIISLDKFSNKNWSMNWRDVHKVAVFKRDCFTYDEICMSLSSVDGSGLVLDEEMKGWSEFTRSLPAYLPTCRSWDNWFSAVAFPAFATNLTAMYSRTPATSTTQLEAA